MKIREGSAVASLVSTTCLPAAPEAAHLGRGLGGGHLLLLLLLLLQDVVQGEEAERAQLVGQAEQVQLGGEWVKAR